MNRVYLTAIGLIATYLLTACATSNEAQTLARATLAQTLAYQDQVKNKIKAENTYYNDSMGAMSLSLNLSKSDNTRIIVDHAVQSMQKMAFNAEKDLQPIDITDFVANTLQKVDASQKKYLAISKEFNNELENQLIKLEKKQSSLKAVASGLETLQAELSEAEQLKNWFKFANEVHKLEKKSNSAN